MKSISEIEVCCGCNACVDVCPKKCIHMRQNGEGFYVVECDSKNCVECGACLSVCPLNEPYPLNGKGQSYIAVAVDEECYKKSSSGGIFPILSKYILEEQGYVWGCGYDENLVPTHMAINSAEYLDNLCRSKYVQSKMGLAFCKIKDQLEDGKKVLFCGTPCQVGGLKKYLKKNYANLYMVDILCHGVPSSKLFADNIKYIQKRNKSAINRYEFRQKTDSNIYQYHYYLSNGQIIVGNYFEDYFFNSFYMSESLNEVCYECPYSCEKRVGDISIGDYEWGKDKHQSFKEYREISCVLVNSDKGEKLFGRIQESLKFEETSIEWIKERNSALINKKVRPKVRNDFYNKICGVGYEVAVREYHLSLYYLKKSRLAILVKKILKRR